MSVQLYKSCDVNVIGITIIMIMGFCFIRISPAISDINQIFLPKLSTLLCRISFIEIKLMSTDYVVDL
jgi:hypothetical protein